MPSPVHVRAQIRAKIVQVLTGLTTTGANVFEGRTRQLKANHPPTWLVYVRSEQSDTHAMGGILGRDLRVRIEGRVVMADVPDGTLDQMAAEAEVAMVADPRLGGLAYEVTLIGTTIDTQAPGESHNGEVTLDYRVKYRTRENAPAVPV